VYIQTLCTIDPPVYRVDWCIDSLSTRRDSIHDPVDWCIEWIGVYSPNYEETLSTIGGLVDRDSISHGG